MTEHKKEKEHEHKQDKKPKKYVSHHRRSSKHKPASEGLAKNSKNKNNFWMVISIVLAALLVLSIAINTSDNESSESGFFTKIKEALSIKKDSSDSGENDVLKSGNVKFDLYVMSQCPYGTQAMDGAIKAKQELGESVNLNIDYIFYDKANYEGKESSYCIEDLCSMHGIAEIKGDIIQLCALDMDEEKAYDMILCMNEEAGKIPDNWESCAQKAGFETESLRECYEGEKGLELARTSKTNALTVGASGSPTIYINDKPYQGARDSLSFSIALCKSLNNHPSCEKLPECNADYHCTAKEGMIGACVDGTCEYSKPVEFKMTIIDDKLCSDCQDLITRTTTALSGIFPGVEFETIDYEENGSDLMQTYGLNVLPAFIVDKEIEQTNAWINEQVNTNVFIESEDKYVVLPQAIGASHDPDAEICDNEKDDRDQDGKIDCEDDECQNQIVCREEIENDLSVFIMSDCPYGKEAVKALKEVVDNFGNSISYSVHYIATEKPDGTFNSLHGAYEAEENIRQLCVKEHSPDGWMDYIYCRSVNGISGVDWKECAQESGIDIDAVEVCVEGDEGKGLLSEDIKIAQALGIGASPTWLANNKYQFSGITAEGVKQNLCEYNELEQCENELSGSADTPSGQC